MTAPLVWVRLERTVRGLGRMGVVLDVDPGLAAWLFGDAAASPANVTMIHGSPGDGERP